jgi:hypothetical protein
MEVLRVSIAIPRDDIRDDGDAGRTIKAKISFLVYFLSKTTVSVSFSFLEIWAA